MDKRLLEYLETNPDTAFKILLEKYGGLVKSICKNLLSGFSPEDIEEAVADCFVALWASRLRLKDADNIRGYIAGIARNRAFDKMRSTLSRSSSISLEELDIGIDADMSDEAARNINSAIVQRVISEMPEFEREIFIRRYYRYEQIKNIASDMNCSAKKVENTLYRYKKKLSEELIKGGIII